MATKTRKNSTKDDNASRKLAPYHAKRDFHVTAEPQGARGKKPHPTTELPFVVQKHDASRLHYDFRLGWKGVLKSWAVTKGPSYCPGYKRLAVQVEDHPMDYKDFEGTIPKGQYGGGTVMVWDRGNWEPNGDVDRGLKEGHLKFNLHGDKLHGTWMLVRMNGRAAGKHKTNWLLIKEHDKFERSEDSPAITDEAVLSAATKRSLEQIANGDARNAAMSHGQSGTDRKSRATKARVAETKSKLRGNGAANSIATLEHTPREPFPGFISPQLAQLARQAPDGPEWLHELKLDGYRIQVHIQSGGPTRSAAHGRHVKLLTRKNLDWSHRMPEIAVAAAQLSVSDAILDGEVVAFNKQGIANFADLQAAFQEGKESLLNYVAFDLLHLNGHNLRGLSFLDRKALLAELLQNLGKDAVIQFSEHLDASGKDVFAEACRLGAEGIVSKLASSKYTSGRGAAWLKIKCTQEQEFVIGGFTPQSKDSRGLGALLLGYFEAGKLRYAGRCGTGFSQHTQRDMRERLDAFERKRPAFADYPEGVLHDVHWVDPVVVAQIAFSNWTRDDRLRQAAFKGLREDKRARDVVRERPITPNKSSRAAVVSSKEKQSHGKRNRGATYMADFAITHPGKILDETTGMTKHDLAAYYAAVSTEILKYIADRPLSIVRCPEGSSKSCFFQKHTGFGVPESVKTIPVPSRKGGATENDLTVDTSEGLMGLAQMAVLEIHVWGSRNDSLDKPDRIVFDLDPDASISWKTLAASALEMREHLRTIGLESFLKGTGGKGLHVVVPIRAEREWPEVKKFSHAVVRQLEKANPDLYVTKMSKAVRKNHIFLDYLRNDREATAIAAFSPRARPGVPVALPLDWKELAGNVMPVFRVVDFTNWKKRLDRDRWARMHALRQRLSPAILRDSGVSV